jgi:hypothetical protein|tara:strand:- start:2596 stop:2874 length:279 start_codon:yes stop_codon:yes gene_type:complete
MATLNEDSKVTIEDVKREILESMKILRKNGWDSKSFRRHTIHAILAYREIIPQKTNMLHIAIKELVAENKICVKESARGSLLFVNKIEVDSK